MLPLKKGEICGYFVSRHDVHVIITHREKIKFMFLAWEETRIWPFSVVCMLKIKYKSSVLAHLIFNNGSYA